MDDDIITQEYWRSAMKTLKQFRVQINEVLKASDPIEKWIDDFVHSKNPKFAGKSTKERIEMAKGAYYAKQKNEAAAISQNSTAVTDMNEDHLVHVNDGSKYDDKPHPKDVEHIMAGVKQHGGEHAGASDKGVFFKFKSKEHAQAFKSHVNKCPNRSCDADLSEAVEYKGIGTDVVDKKKVLNPQPNLTTDKKTVKDFKEEALDEAGKVYDPITKKMVARKPIKVQAGGGATRNGVPVETGPSKHKQSLKNEGIELIAKHEVKANAPHKSGGHVVLTKSSNKWHVLHNKKSSPEAKDLHRSKLLHSYADEKEARAKFKELHEEQIDEISKSTLMRYIPKASRDVGSHTYAGKEAGEWASHYTRAGDWAAAEKQSKKSYADFKKANKRIAGIDTATKKLGTQKEEVELDEASHQVYDTKTQKVHSTHDTYKKAVNAAEKLNKSHEGYETPGNIVKAKFGARTVKEEVQIDEATVSSRKYDWGTMKTVNHGKSFSIPLHPEHHEPISKLKHGESHSFKDETGRKWKATRDNDTVHFHGGSYGTQKTSVPHKSMTEETVEESRGHKTLATFFKNREVAQRAYQGNPAKDAEVAQGGGTPADQGIAAAKKDAEDLKKKVSEAKTPAVHAAEPKKTKSTAKSYASATIPGTKRVAHAKPDNNEVGGGTATRIAEDQYTSEYKIKYYVDPITGENKQRKIRPHRVNFANSKMRGEPAQADAQGDYGMKESYVVEGGFDNYHEIAKELVKRHGKNVDTSHINDLAGERDTHRGLDHSEVMHHVKKILSSKDVKEGDEYDEMWKEYKGKTFKKESRMLKFNDYLKEAALSAKQKKIAAIAGDKEKIDADDLAALRAGKKPVEEAKDGWSDNDSLAKPVTSNQAMADHAKYFNKVTKLDPKTGEPVKKPVEEASCSDKYMKKEELVGNQHKLDKNKNGKLDAQDFKMLRKEEAEQLDELSPSTLKSYKKGITRDLDRAADAYPHGTGDDDEDRKLNNRVKGDELADKKLKAKGVNPYSEEVEQIDEISKDTLKSYIPKAAKSSRIHGMISTDYKNRADRVRKPGLKKALANLSDKYKSKAWSREDMIGKAVNKLTKEEVQIDEGKMKELSMDLTDMGHDEFHKKYGNPKSHYDPTSFKKPVQPGKEMDRARALAQRGMKSVSEQLEEATTRKDFQMVADLIKGHESAEKRKELATHHAGIFAKQNPRFDHAKFMKAAGVNEEVQQEQSPYLKATLQVMDEGKIDNLRDAQALRKATQSAYDKNFKPDTTHPHIQVVKGTQYGGENQKDDEGDEKPEADKEKRGRGRPSGSKSGARLKGGGLEDGGIPVHNLHLPKSYK
jgi:hypothetical protein